MNTTSSPVALPVVAANLRKLLKNRKFVLLYGHNGTGKTRLSTEFKKIGKKVDAAGETIERDTLYFNAFTEDLFSWDNDLAEDLQPRMVVNPYSSLISAFGDLEFRRSLPFNPERFPPAKT